MLMPDAVLETAKELVRQVEAGRIGANGLALQVLKLERATAISLLRAEAAKAMKSSKPAPSVVINPGGAGGFANESCVMTAIRAVRELQAFLERHLDARHVVEGVTARVLDALESKREDRSGLGIGSMVGGGGGIGMGQSGVGGGAGGAGGAGGGEMRMGLGGVGFPFNLTMGMRMGIADFNHFMTKGLDALVDRLNASESELIDQVSVCVNPGDHIMILPTPRPAPAEDDDDDGKDQSADSTKGKGGKAAARNNDHQHDDDQTTNIIQAAIVQAVEKMNEEEHLLQYYNCGKDFKVRVSVVEFQPDDHGAAASAVRFLSKHKGVQARVTQDRYCTRDMQALDNDGWGAVNKVVLLADMLDVEHGIGCTAGSTMVCNVAYRLRVPVLSVVSKFAMLPVQSAFVSQMGQQQKYPGFIWQYDDACDHRLRDSIGVIAPQFDFITLNKVDLVITESGGYDPDFLGNLVPTYFEQEHVQEHEQAHEHEQAPEEADEKVQEQGKEHVQGQDPEQEEQAQGQEHEQEENHGQAPEQAQDQDEDKAQEHIQEPIQEPVKDSPNNDAKDGN